MATESLIANYVGVCGTWYSIYLLPAVRADFLRRLGLTAEAAACYQEALTYRCTEPERRFLLRRIDGLKEWEAE